MPILAAREDVEMVGVCRLGAAELRLVQERFGFRVATEDVSALLRTPLDGVVISSPHALHFEHARMALQAGCHVMIEKPMTTRHEDARAILDLAGRLDRHVVVPYGWNYRPFVRVARQWLDEGVVGEVEYVNLQMASPIRGLLEGTNVEMGGPIFQPDAATWADPVVAGGGYAHAQLSHATGLLFYLLPELRAEQVFAFMSAPRARVDLFDAIAVRYRGGALGTVGGAGAIPRGLKFHLDLRIFGREGMLLLDIERERLELRREDGADRALPIDPGEGAYRCDGPPHRFVDLIRGLTTENPSDAAVGERSVGLIDAAYRSALSGQPERVPD